MTAESRPTAAHDGDRGPTNLSDDDTTLAVREDWRAIVRFLASSPDDFGVVLTLARLHRPADVLTFEADAARHLADKERAQAYVRAALCQACARCLQPVAVFPDGRLLDWPSLDRHDRCLDVSDAVAVKPTTAARRSSPSSSPSPSSSRRPAWKRAAPA